MNHYLTHKTLHQDHIYQASRHTIPSNNEKLIFHYLILLLLSVLLVAAFIQRLNAAHSTASREALRQPVFVSPPLTVGFVERKYLNFCCEYFSFRYKANTKPAGGTRFESLVSRSLKFHRLLWPGCFSGGISKLFSTDSSNPVSFRVHNKPARWTWNVC